MIVPQILLHVFTKNQGTQESVLFESPYLVTVRSGFLLHD